MGKYNVRVKEERTELLPGRESSVPVVASGSGDTASLLPPLSSSSSSSSFPSANHPSGLRIFSTVLASLRSSGYVSKNLLRLYHESQTEWKLILTGFLCMLISTLTSLTMPALFGSLLDSLTGLSSSSPVSDATETLQSLLLWLIVISITDAVVSFTKSYCFTLAGERTVNRLRKKVFHHLIQMEIGFFDSVRVTELISRLTGDISLVKDIATSQLSVLVKSLLMITGGLLYLLSVSTRLTMVLIIIVPLIAVGARYYGKYTKKLSKEVRNAIAEASVSAEESMSNIRTVRSFAKETAREHLFNEKINTSYQLGVRSAFVSGLFSGGLQGVTMLAFVILLYYGSILIQQKELSTGILTSFLLYAVRIGASLNGLAGVFVNIMTSLGATERVFQLLDRIPWVPTAEGENIRTPIDGTIEFRDVCFTYPGRSDVPVLQNMSFQVPSGTIAALVGPSGAGKSTIISLIERFYDPDSGSITIDHQNIHALNGSSIRQQIGLVLQEPVLFATTIRENIAFGRPDATDDEIIEASKAAFAHDFIQHFPSGYDTHISTRTLSGGEKQRIAIARAILQNPRILLLDEATSALDSESEYMVKKALDELMKDRTTIIVAHRLSTVRQAHIVFVVANGRIVDQGTHEQLLRTNGLYARLVRRQMLSISSLGIKSSDSSDSAVVTSSSEQMTAIEQEIFNQLSFDNDNLEDTGSATETKNNQGLIGGIISNNRTRNSNPKKISNNDGTNVYDKERNVDNHEYTKESFGSSSVLPHVTITMDHKEPKR